MMGSFKFIDLAAAAELVAAFSAAVVMPVVTLALFYATKVMALETRRMARATSQPHVVVTFEENLWSTFFFDICVTNTGNATAYEISVRFDPPLKGYEPADPRDGPPLQAVSVLRPGQTISSFLGEMNDELRSQQCMVTVSWRPQDGKERESNAYAIDFGFIRNMSVLGERSALTQIAKEARRIREAAEPVLKGRSRMKQDIYSEEDRSRESVERYLQIREARVRRGKKPTKGDGGN